MMRIYVSTLLPLILFLHNSYTTGTMYYNTQCCCVVRMYCWCIPLQPSALLTLRSMNSAHCWPARWLPNKNVVGRLFIYFGRKNCARRSVVDGDLERGPYLWHRVIYKLVSARSKKSRTWQSTAVHCCTETLKSGLKQLYSSRCTSRCGRDCGQKTRKELYERSRIIYLVYLEHKCVFTQQHSVYCEETPRHQQQHRSATHLEIQSPAQTSRYTWNSSIAYYSRFDEVVREPLAR